MPAPVCSAIFPNTNPQTYSGLLRLPWEHPAGGGRCRVLGDQRGAAGRLAPCARPPACALPCQETPRIKAALVFASPVCAFRARFPSASCDHTHAPGIGTRPPARALPCFKTTSKGRLLLAISSACPRRGRVSGQRNSGHAILRRRSWESVTAKRPALARRVRVKAVFHSLHRVFIDYNRPCLFSPCPVLKIISIPSPKGAAPPARFSLLLPLCLGGMIYLR